WGGTFHHMTNRILRRNAAALGYRSDYTILDRDDSKKLINTCIRNRDLKQKEFPKPEVLLGIFSAATNTRTPVADLVEKRLHDSCADPEDVLRVHRAYEEGKKRLGSLDFDDLLVHCLRLFREKPAVLERYREQFRHVLVDEYQDTNVIQMELVDCLGSKHRNVFVVGDDFQSIYGWRGADYRNIMSFPERYTDAAVYKLETNYRSVPEILAVANACIAVNPGQYPKELRATRESHDLPLLLKVRDGGEQARHIAEDIVRLRREGYAHSDICILYRAHFHAMEVQMEFTRQNVPYVITSGVRFFEQAHIKDVCCVLRLLDNPEDQLAFSRLVSMLPGVAERTAANVWKKLGQSYDASAADARKALCKALPAAAASLWGSIEPVLEAYHAENLNGDGGEVIHRFVQAFYEEHAVNAFENAENRLDDIRELILYTARFETVREFLSDVALLTNLDATGENLNTSEGDAVRLSTIHQAKGLEWGVVFLIWATEGMFPSPRSLRESPVGEFEERRLFYVAVTRAKDELCMSAPEVRRARDGSVTYYRPSRFLEEIPRELVREIRGTFV
ncbi:MAG: UvrD-helicase domain-containing protein, partial [Lentisphaerae bacterium]|nr:UvrD-helicase domain-containing protein [Lentisphaerota bacterium]